MFLQKNDKNLKGGGVTYLLIRGFVFSTITGRSIEPRLSDQIFFVSLASTCDGGHIVWNLRKVLSYKMRKMKSMSWREKMVFLNTIFSLISDLILKPIFSPSGILLRLLQGWIGRKWPQVNQSIKFRKKFIGTIGKGVQPVVFQWY